MASKLTIDGSTDLHIGVNPDNQNAGYFLGMLDEVRLYGVAFGSEDVQHLFKLDSNLLDYQPPSPQSRVAVSGSVVQVTSPIVPVINHQLLPTG